MSDGKCQRFDTRRRFDLVCLEAIIFLIFNNCCLFLITLNI